MGDRLQKILARAGIASRRASEELIRAGRVFCAARELDGPGAVAVRGDRIVAAGPT